MNKRVRNNIIFAIILIIMNFFAYDYDVVAGVLMSCLSAVLAFMLWSLSHFDGWKS